MKKALVMLSLLILLAGCGQQSTNQDIEKISVQNGAFTCQPADVVSKINLMVESDADGVLLGLGEYKGSGEAIDADDLGRLQLTMEANNDGNLTKARLYWDSSTNNENIITSAGAYCSVLFEMLSPGNAETIHDGVSQIISSGSGEVEYENDGVLVSFQSLRGLNWLDIEAITS